jgi:tetratricopeptide (TPR) repeat protein
MPSEPVPLLFQLYFYSAIAMAVIVSLIAIVLYRRAVRRNMLAKDGSRPVLPIAPVDGETRSRLPLVPAGDYAVAALRVKIWIALIYSGAILAVGLFAAWIRFFTGNTTLIRGSIMFLMWKGPLGGPVALGLSASLFSAVGIPLLAVLLAWSWRRAAAVFVLYVGVWAAGAFALMVVRYGWRMADWASTLVLAQVTLIGLVAPQPFLLLLVTGNRRVRAVVPMTLAGSLVFCAVLLGAAFLQAEVNRSLATKAFESLGKSGHLVTIALILALLITVSLMVCWSALRVLATLYERKLYSDRQLLVDCWSLVVILYVFARLGETPGTPQVLIAIAFIVFFVYRLLIHIALRLLVPRIRRPPNRRLLLLRTFGFQKRTERLFDAIGERWRFHGAVLMIAGSDLAVRTINPADYLRFVSRRLRHRFLMTDADLQRNLDRLDEWPDPDGRYRVNELFCGDDAWHKAVVALLDRAEVVLMDLRGFGADNRGCLFELQQLVERGPVGQVFLTVDDTTDRTLLDRTIQDAWSRMPDSARRPGAADPNVLPMKKATPRAMEAILVALQGGKPASFLSALRRDDSSGPGDRRPDDALRLERAEFRMPRRKRSAIALLAAVTGLLLISLPRRPNRPSRPGTHERAAAPSALVEAYNNVPFTLVPALKDKDAEAHYSRAFDLQHNGDYDGAIEEYRKALALRPDMADAHHKLGAILYQKGDYEPALAEFRKAVAAKPDLADAHHNIGVILDRKGDYDAAIAEYRKALAANPQLAESRYNLGADLDRQGDYEAAIAEYRKAVAAKPDLADAHYNLGVDLDRKGDYDAAIGAYQKALAAMPDMTDAHYNLGVDLFRKDDTEAAIAEFQKALALKPDLAEAHTYLGGILFRKGDADAAIAEFRKTLAVKPDLAEAHYNIAFALYDKGDYEPAIAECRKALTLKSDCVQAHYCLALALHATGRGQEAEREFHAAHRLNPTLKRPWN